jgi:hypothetical protein
MDTPKKNRSGLQNNFSLTAGGSVIPVTRLIRPSSSAPATNSTRAEGIANHSTGDLHGQQGPSLAAFPMFSSKMPGKEVESLRRVQRRSLWAACEAGRKAASEASSGSLSSPPIKPIAPSISELQARLIACNSRQFDEGVFLRKVSQ